MSLVFSNTSTSSGTNGIIQEIEAELGLDPGSISGNTALMKSFTSSVNLALDKFVSLAIQASGTWQFDDSNQTDYPIIKSNIVSGQRDYSFVTDGSGNLILDIYKVAILPSATATLYQSIEPIDEIRSTSNLDLDTDIVRESTNTSVPYGYGKLANGIFLEQAPSYSVANGLKLFINREAYYFTVGDSTRKPGVTGILHEYFYLRPARDYARRKGLASYDRLNREVIKYEGDESLGIRGEITKSFARREKDVRRIMSGKRINYI